MESTSPETADSQWIARLRLGEEAAAEQFFRTHVGAALAVARRYLGDTDDAADAVQDAFVSAFRSVQAFEANSRIGSWLYRIVVNACLMKLRSRRRRRLVSFDGFEFPAPNPDEDQASRSETVRRVRECIDELPPSFRTILMLRDFEGLDTAAAARHLGTSESVVKTRLHRARHALREKLVPWVAGL